MGKSEIQKLIYLFERESVIRTGKQSIGLAYRHDKFGMYSPELATSLASLEAEGFLVSRSVHADMGEGRLYRLGEGVSREVNPAVAELCDAIRKVPRARGLRGLIAFAKSTDPFVTTPKGAWIDWREFAHEQCGSAHALLPEVGAELRAAVEAKPARILSRDAAVRELERAG